MIRIANKLRHSGNYSESIPDPKRDTHPEPNLEPHTESNSELIPDSKTEAHSESNPELKSEPNIEPISEPESESNSESDSKLNSVPKTEAQSESNSDLHSEPNSESNSELNLKRNLELNGDGLELLSIPVFCNLKDVKNNPVWILCMKTYQQIDTSDPGKPYRTFFLQETICHFVGQKTSCFKVMSSESSEEYEWGQVPILRLEPRQERSRQEIPLQENVLQYLQPKDKKQLKKEKKQRKKEEKERNKRMKRQKDGKNLSDRQSVMSMDSWQES